MALLGIIVWGFFCVFWKKNLEYISPFCGTTDTPVLDFWWHLFWVWKKVCSALFTFGRGICVMHSLRFTSGATPADQHGSWADLFHIPVTRHWWGSNRRPIMPLANALPTELCRLGWHHCFTFGNYQVKKAKWQSLRELDLNPNFVCKSVQ